jgi:signal transduction histidine kinase
LRGDSGPRDPSLREAEFDELLREVLGRVEGVLDERARWELLLDAVVAMGADLSLDGLLERIVSIASRLVTARYAALGVLDLGNERRLRTFIHHGMDEDVVREIGDLPSGHGLLGLIIDRPEPLRLHDIAQHPASYGFPEHHPPMSSFLGVPLRTRDKVFGNLYLTEKVGGGDFTEQDERIVVALASAAGVAIENAELYQEARRRERWLAATAEVTGELLREGEGPHALQVVADQARAVAEADVVWIVAGPTADELDTQVASGDGIDAERLRRVPTKLSLSAEVVRSGTPMVVEDLTGDPRSLWASVGGDAPRLGPGILVPFGRGTELPGVLGLGWTHERVDRYHDLDPALPASFAEQAALSLQMSRYHEDRQRLAVFEDRDRIGRDLHDLVIQRLFAVGLSLQGTARLVGASDVAQRLEAAVDDLDTTIKDIRKTIFELGLAAQSNDVQAEVIRLVDRAAATLKFRPSLDFEGPVRTLVADDQVPDLLAVLSEALSNAARHAEASRVAVRLRVGDEVVLEVADNGRGIPPGTAESGLRNMRERARRRGGSCTVESRAGSGTRVRWAIPRETPAADPPGGQES